MPQQQDQWVLTLSKKFAKILAQGFCFPAHSNENGGQLAPDSKLSGVVQLAFSAVASFSVPFISQLTTTFSPTLNAFRS